MKRISIVGPAGSGKSTLAVKLGEILNLPVYHIDCYFLKPDWQPTDKQELAKQIAEITKNDAWIIEGNYKLTLENRFEKSDKIIFLNLPFEFCLDSIKQRHHQKEKRVGLPEYLDMTEERLPELIEKISAKGHYDELHRLVEKYKSKVIELKNRSEVNDFLCSLKPVNGSDEWS